MSGRQATRQKKKKRKRIASEKGNKRCINFNSCILRGRALSLYLLLSRAEWEKHTNRHRISKGSSNAHNTTTTNKNKQSRQKIDNGEGEDAYLRSGRRGNPGALRP